MFGDGIVATCVAGLSQSGRGELGFNSGDWILITFAWGFAVMLGVYVAGGVSGAHLNPAVTFAQALRRGFPWKKVPTYIVAQVFGAFVAAAVVYFNYRFAIGSFEHVEHITRGTLRTRSGPIRSSPPSRPNTSPPGSARSWTR